MIEVIENKSDEIHIMCQQKRNSEERVEENGLVKVNMNGGSSMLKR